MPCEEREKMIKKEGDKKGDDKSKSNMSAGKSSVHDRLNYNRGRQEPRMPTKNLTPLTKPRAEILALHRDVLRTPPPLLAPPHKRNRDLWCFYHNDHGHDTEDCNDLKKEVEDCLKNGMLLQYVQRIASNSGRWQPRQQGCHLLRGDQYCAKECMRIAFKGKWQGREIASVNMVHTGTAAESDTTRTEQKMESITEEVQTVVLDPECPDRTIQIGKSLILFLPLPVAIRGTDRRLDFKSHLRS